MPERVFGPSSSHGVLVNAGSIIKARIRQESGDTQTLKHLRFGVAQLEPQGTGMVPLPGAPGPTGPIFTTGAWIAAAHQTEPRGLGIVVQNGSPTSLGVDLPNTGFGVAWSPDGTRIAYGHSGSPYLTIWNIEADEAETGWPTLTGGGRSLAWSPDGSRLAVPTSDGSGGPNLYVIDVESKQVESGWPSLASFGGVCSFSPDGSRLACGHAGSPRLTVIDTGTKQVESGWPSFSSSVNGAAWSPSGDRLAVRPATGSPNYSVIDTATRTIESGWYSDIGSNSQGVAWSPDGQKLALSDAGELVVIDISDIGEKEAGWPETLGIGGLAHIAWWPDGGTSIAAVGGSGDHLAVVDADTKTLEVGWPTLPNNGNAVAFAFDPGNVTSG